MDDDTDPLSEVPEEVWREFTTELESEIADWKRGVVASMRERHGDTEQ